MKRKILQFALLILSLLFYSQSKNEIAYQLLQQKQESYTYIISYAQKFKYLEIKHLDGEDENYNVNEKIRYYNDRVDAILTAINKDKINASAYLQYVDKLKFEINQDFQTGDLYKIEASYYARKQFFEDYKKLREENPEKFMQIVRDADKKWGGNSLNGIWSPY